MYEHLSFNRYRRDISGMLRQVEFQTSLSQNEIEEQFKYFNPILNQGFLH